MIPILHLPSLYLFTPPAQKFTWLKPCWSSDWNWLILDTKKKKKKPIHRFILHSWNIVFTWSTNGLKEASWVYFLKKRKKISSWNVPETKQNISHWPLLGIILSLQLAVAWQHPPKDPRGTERRERASERAVGVREPWQELIHAASLPHTHLAECCVFRWRLIFFY